MSPAALSFTILGLTIVLFVWNRLPVEMVALGSALALYFTGVLDLGQLFGGFGDPVVIFIAALFVVSAGLDTSGATAWAGQRLAGHSYVVTLLLAAALTALITVNGAVAALLPMTVLLAIRSALPPSRLAMPLAFTAHAGSLLLLTGTPINVLISEAAAGNGGRAFGFLEFALAGIPLVAGSLAVIVFLGPRLLPQRTPHTIPADLSAHARTLVKHYRLDENVYRLQGTPSMPPVPPVTLLGRQGPGVLIVHGALSDVERYAARSGLTFLPEPSSGHVEGALITPDLGVAEAVVSPRSGLAGTEVFPGMVTESGDLVVLAVQRRDSTMDREPVTLESGDTLLLQGTWQALDRHIDADRDVLAVDAPLAIRSQAAPLGASGKRAAVILAAMVVLLATGLIPVAVAALLAAGAMVLLRVVTMTQAYRGINWTTLVIVAAMIPLSEAMRQSGAAAVIADGLVRLVGDAGPYALLLGLFAVTAILGQMISNMATALIIIPVALSAAATLGVSVQPVLMCVGIAAAASFLTPVATPANMMVKGPGGYRFGDYWRLGLPLLLWFGVVAVGLVPQIWRF